MPVNKKMMKSMKKTYGSKKGTSIYYALENKKKSKITDMASKNYKG